jgi:cell division protein FtsW (lipid II flippase)
LQRDDQNTQYKLFLLAAIFLGIYSVALTLAPGVKSRSWEANYPWEHWLGYLVWLVGFWAVYKQVNRSAHFKNISLIPLISIFSGWGLLTIWRLTPTFGLRQTVWLGISLSVLFVSLRTYSDLRFLRRYKYIWLTSGLLLTSLTLIFGTNPMEFGPRLWLGCCGIYLQPSEPLKLLLVVYLAAYFADWSTVLAAYQQETKALIPHILPQTHKNKSTENPTPKRTIPQLQILVPTVIMTGLAILLLLVQRDLGTASIFIFLYSVMVFLATGWKWVPVASVGALLSAGILGYQAFDVIRLRVDAWLNPWQDPSGRSYQIVQSLIAIANGGIVGRGPGLGEPDVVPVTHSDFIFTALAEDGGLISTIGFFVLLGLLVYHGLTIANRATDNFRRYLAAGLTAFLAAQSILIIGGNLRLLPLTGVTLPFVSYGGSSLLVSFTIVILLLHSGASAEENGGISVSIKRSEPFIKLQSSITNLSTFFLISLIAASFAAGWWAFLRGPNLLTRTDNPRRAIADRNVERGSLLDRHGTPIIETISLDSELTRMVRYPDLGPIIGYSHPRYGQSGLEASLDPILRGIQGNDPFTVWWNNLLYGQPPPGLDIRLTLDLALQSLADEVLSGHTGALVLLNAESGEILAMASHPSFDPNLMDAQWDELVLDPQSPLLNRVTQGVYPSGDLIESILTQTDTSTKTGPISLTLPLSGTDYPVETTPLELSLAAAALSNGGIRPGPFIAQLMENPGGGWVLLPQMMAPEAIIDPEKAQEITQGLQASNSETWRLSSTPEGHKFTWYIGGTTSNWGGIPLAITIALEEENIPLVDEIGQLILSAAMRP